MLSKHLRRIILGLACGLLCTVCSAVPELNAQAQRGALDGLDAYISTAMRDWRVPGLAIGIVRGDSIILAKGYGTRTIDRAEPVDEHTLFPIASATKAFTSALAAMMVGEGKIRWDEPVTTLLPSFELYDPYASRELTLRDLLAHRSGLPRADFLWYANGYDRVEILRRIRYLQPTSSLRSRFSYANITYVAAGEAIAAAAGRSWDDLVRDRIFAPLGMTATNSSVRELANRSNVATPYGVAGRRWFTMDNIAAAGAVNSNVSDMLKWVRFQLSEGKVGGHQLVGPNALNETRTAQQIVPLSATARQLNPFTHFVSYGMGWYLSDYRGRELHSHGGDMDGMSAQVALMPEERIGLVILTNAEVPQLPDVVMYWTLDVLLGMPPRDWSSEYLKVAEAQRAAAQAVEEKRLGQRVKGTAPSLPLDHYVGIYADDVYGDAKVWLEEGKLMMSYGRVFEGNLEHWHFDTFRAHWRGGGTRFVTFTLDPVGKVSTLGLETIGTLRRRPAAGGTAGRML